MASSLVLCGKQGKLYPLFILDSTHHPPLQHDKWSHLELHTYQLRCCGQ